MAGGGMGGQSSVVGGQNLSTPSVAGPNGMQMLGMPQTSQLSGMQNAFGGLSGNGNYQMASSPWQQVLQHMQQGQQGKGGIATNLMGMMGGQSGQGAMIGKLLGLL